MSEVRRSSRLRSRSSNVTSRNSSPSSDERGRSVSVIQTDDNTAMTDISDEESSSDEENNEVDEDYEEPSRARRSKKRKPKAKKAVGTKRSKSGRSLKATSNDIERPKPVNLGGSKKEQEHYLEVVKDFEATELFSILATAEDISVDELIREWLETYKENRDHFLQEFINLLLCCCGAVARVEEHDVHSNESSNETITEVQILFQKQKMHEFHLLISKNNKRKAKYKNLYDNFIEFMSKIMEIANDMQLLYSESEDDNEITSNPFVIDLLTWLSSLSVCKIRCLRYVSTLSLYLFQDSLTEYVVEIESKYLSKLTKQLTQEQKKKRPSTKTMEKLEASIEELQSNKAVTEGIIDNIVKLSFVHRFKDIDESIRSESILHLSTWIKHYPEYFLKVTFLKYFGWLLSDSSVDVRLQVLKTLPQLISKHNKKSVDNSAVRQFFERFKERIFDMALKDIDLEVRLNAVNVLIEVAPLGYLEDAEILALSSLIFVNRKVKVSSHSKNSRFLATVAKFFARVTIEKCEEFSSSYDVPESIFGLDSNSLIKIAILVGLLSKSLIYHLQNSEALDSTEKLEILFQAAEFLHPYYGSLIEDICKLLTYDSELSYSFLQLENSDEENSVRETLLLPDKSENITIYTAILSGLCHGGSIQGTQQKFRIAESVLPYIENLLTYLPVHQINILEPILSIFNIFTFEDWIHAGYEKKLSTIVDKILRIFSECMLDGDSRDLRYKSFSATLETIKKMNLNELNEICINQISYLKLQFQKFLIERMDPNEYEIDFNETIATLYGRYLNKMVLLGKDYELEVDKQLLQSFMENFLSRVPKFFESCSFDTIKLMNFRFLTLIVTWQLHKWTEIIQNSIDTDATVEVSVDVIQMIASIVERLNTTLITTDNDEYINSEKLAECMLLKLNISTSLMDIVSALKIFDISLPENESSWKESIKENFPYYLHDKVSDILYQIFLYLEAIFSKEIGENIERLAGENVNFNDIENNGVFNNVEAELLLFTIKLKGLIKLKILKGDINERVKLNKDIFGPLFISIVDETIFENNSKKQPHKLQKNIHQPEHRAVLLSSAGDIESDPIEGSPERTSHHVEDIEMIDNDPIEDSDS
ncbi:hypothetical protein Kpol_1070p36 [Vanderwaltozyma polyspora DSM 70294]|uniref:SCD domain-containing protein n=1 Tax=Vanderwaltozyma polyspora (strain ATCC 22028 / DSM 70294 / BCRC 21397 / CBS 2163 / NBRC 10782 / NRRL Y-8283 / UCD 57-17) TaxID=436907 RepID=A7TNN6_VANPO|nr:uncharacterized protein Kpol_1070p36 [Vanderwaltozyma polyspora DSM 70294]EDO16153.1 hypothetical protein Kpol_1070p36 [Vanderwaltozyma polyspora DSM 70294]